MQTKPVLLEPWYRFRLEVPEAQIGRAITDVKSRFGSFETPESRDGFSILRGRAPVSAFNDYARELASYTRGQGKLRVQLDGYDLCHNPDEVLADFGYDPEADTENTPDSVFCAHGGGFTVKWNQVFSHMHLESVLAKPQDAPLPAPRRRNLSIDEKELQAIMDREFGPIRRPSYREPARFREHEPELVLPERRVTKYLIVDGFNVIFAWDDLAAIAAQDLEQARLRLMELLANYSAFTRTETILVFDAYRVPGGKGERFDFHGIHVVYTRENETGDAYIERLCHDIGKNEQVRIVTSDNLIQVSALRSGVLRVSAREFGEELDRVYGEIGTYLRGLNVQKMGTVGENLKKEPNDDGTRSSAAPRGGSAAPL